MLFGLLRGCASFFPTVDEFGSAGVVWVRRFDILVWGVMFCDSFSVRTICVGESGCVVAAFVW